MQSIGFGNRVITRIGDSSGARPHDIASIASHRRAAIGAGAIAVYIGAMHDLFPILMVLAMLAVVGSLFVGLFFMARGGRGDPRRSNKAMRLRVILQGAALLLFVIAILIKD